MKDRFIDGLAEDFLEYLHSLDTTITSIDFLQILHVTCLKTKSVDDLKRIASKLRIINEYYGGHELMNLPCYWKNRNTGEVTEIEYAMPEEAELTFLDKRLLKNVQNFIKITGERESGERRQVYGIIPGDTLLKFIKEQSDGAVNLLDYGFIPFYLGEELSAEKAIEIEGELSLNSNIFMIKQYQ